MKRISNCQGCKVIRMNNEDSDQIAQIWAFVEHACQTVCFLTQIVNRYITYLKLFLVISAENIIYSCQGEIFPLKRYHSSRRA